MAYLAVAVDAGSSIRPVVIRGTRSSYAVANVIRRGGKVTVDLWPPAIHPEGGLECGIDLRARVRRSPGALRRAGF